MTTSTAVEAVVKKERHQRCRGCSMFIYNRAEGSVFLRTPKSWAGILLYFTMFYSVIGGIFAVMLAVFLFAFVGQTTPYRSGDNSLLRLAAGTNVYPRLSVTSATVVLPTNPNNSLYLDYANSVNLFFKDSFNRNSSNGVKCPQAGDQPVDLGRFCEFTKDRLGPCNDPISQMRLGNLCVYVRVNKVFGWLPKVKNTTTSKDILVDCSGQNPGDVVALGQPVYYPSFTSGSKSYGTIGTEFFPFINQSGYVSPMVAVQFPFMKTNLAILIQCQAQNLDNSFQRVNFEVMILDRKV